NTAPPGTLVPRSSLVAFSERRSWQSLLSTSSHIVFGEVWPSLHRKGERYDAPTRARRERSGSYDARGLASPGYCFGHCCAPYVDRPPRLLRRSGRRQLGIDRHGFALFGERDHRDG